MAKHVQTYTHNPKIAQAEEMQAHRPRNENTLIAGTPLRFL